MADEPEFRLTFRREPTPADAAVVYRVEASGAAGSSRAGSFTLPFSPVELENYILRFSRTRRTVRRIDSPEMTAARKFGGTLFQALMIDDVGDGYRVAQGIASGGRQNLRIAISLTEAPELAAIPWEFLYDERSFLAISERTPIVRCLDVEGPSRPLEMTLPLRILAVQSQPRGVPKLGTGSERALLTAALASVSGAVQCDWLAEATLGALNQRLRGGEYHILHFIGHGTFDQTHKEGALAFEDQDGNLDVVGGDRLAAIVGPRESLRLVVLNSCEGARSDVSDPFSGVAGRLIGQDVPAVIGMQFEITDRAAILFAREFYTMLAEGKAVDSAVSEARLAILADQNDVEWATPALFIRGSDAYLFSITDAAPIVRVEPKLPDKLGEPVPKDDDGAPPEDGAPPDDPAILVRVAPDNVTLTERIREWFLGGARGGEIAIPASLDDELAAGPPEAAAAAESDAGGPVIEAGATRQRYRAYGLLACDETVLVERPFPLELGLSKQQAAGVSGGPLRLPEPERPYVVDVQLFADGFDLGPGEAWRHSLPVERTRDERTLYPTVTVHLTARSQLDPIVDRKISATFSIDGETLGLAERYVQVTRNEADLPAADAPAPAASGANIAAPSGEPKAHLTITIRKGVREGTLTWGLESTLAGIALPADRPVTSDIGQNPQAFAKALIQVLYLQGHGPGVFQLLQGIGKRVRNELPNEVRDAIAAAGPAAKPDRLSILFLTEEPFVPWELAWVDDPWEPAPNYLGAQAVIGRWLCAPGITADPRRNVSVQSMAVVSGVYTKQQRLLAAEEEARQLQAVYRAAPIDAQPQPVTDLLIGSPAADIIHFAVHGKYDPDGAGDGIHLVSGAPVNPLQILGSDLTARAPFVFLNACQVGSAGEMLGDYNGIAEAFIQAGASAVVAPLWNVDDTIAQKIALGFYEDAIGAQAEAVADAGEPPLVAELLRQARAGLVANAADMSATYLAYQFYGHPSLRLTWMPVVAPGAPAAAPGGPANG